MLTAANFDLYPRDRCKLLRARAMEQARKHKDAGRKSEALTWIGHALYWSTRVRTGLAPDAAQDIAHARGARYNVRSAAQMEATRAQTVPMSTVTARQTVAANLASTMGVSATTLLGAFVEDGEGSV